MSVARAIVAGSLLAGSVLATPVPQGPNTVYQNNPTLRTMSTNETWTVIPLNFDLVQSVVSPKKLIPVADDPSRFPNGWPAGTHPVVVSGGFSAYIEMAGLSIPNSLMSAAVRIPNVDELGDGKTPFNYPVADFIGGANGQLLPGTVPALVGSLEGTTEHEGEFDPDSEALKPLGDGESTFGVLDLIVPNPLSGPAVAPPAISYTIHRADPSWITSSGFHYFINQVLIQNNGMCQRNNIYYNESFAQPFFAEGTVQLDGYLDGLNGIPDALAGTYTNGSAYSANGESVGYNAQSCQDAAASNDPKSMQ